jgi:hypothetical protein
VDGIVRVKNVAFSVCVMSSVSLFAMEIEIYKKSKFAMDVEPKKKSEDSCVVKKALFCAEIMKQYGLPQEIASVVACKSYLLRNAEIYQKFDPFFHFDNDNYGVMREKHCRAKEAFINENRGHLGNHDLERFNKQYPYNFNLCRKCDAVAPHNLFFLTAKQDEILLLLTSLPKRFVHFTSGSCDTMILTFDEKEHEQYLILPPALLKLLSKHTINIIEEWTNSSGEPHEAVVSNRYSGLFMNDF